MSQFETDRENQAVEETCAVCGHAAHLHGLDGCAFNSDHHLADFGAVAGPCGCDEKQRQDTLAVLGRNLAGYLQNSSPLVVRRERLAESFEDL